MSWEYFENGARLYQTGLNTLSSSVQPVKYVIVIIVESFHALAYAAQQKAA
jgi:hypothetical protein